MWQKIEYMPVVNVFPFVSDPYGFRTNYRSRSPRHRQRERRNSTHQFPTLRSKSTPAPTQVRNPRNSVKTKTQKWKLFTVTNLYHIKENAKIEKKNNKRVLSTFGSSLNITLTLQWRHMSVIAYQIHTPSWYENYMHKPLWLTMPKQINLEQQTSIDPVPTHFFQSCLHLVMHYMLFLVMLKPYAIYIFYWLALFYFCGELWLTVANGACITRVTWTHRPLGDHRKILDI